MASYSPIRLPKQAYFYLRVYYQTSRDVLPGQELLIHYGKQYAKYLGIWSEYNFSLVTLLSVLLPSVIKINIIISFSGGSCLWGNIEVNYSHLGITVITQKFMF